MLDTLCVRNLALSLMEGEVMVYYYYNCYDSEYILTLSQIKNIIFNYQHLIISAYCMFVLLSLPQGREHRRCELQRQCRRH